MIGKDWTYVKSLLVKDMSHKEACMHGLIDILRPETIAALEQTRQDCTANAYCDGERQAAALLDETPEYSFLCKLADMANDKGKPDVSLIDKRELPNELAGAVIAGFYQTVLDAVEALET